MLQLMGRLKKEFPRLPVCFCADSLYACEKIFGICHDSEWYYIHRFKGASIPTVAEEYRSLKKQKKTSGSGCSVTEPDGMILLGHKLNIAEYREERDPTEIANPAVTVKPKQGYRT